MRQSSPRLAHLLALVSLSALLGATACQQPPGGASAGGGGRAATAQDSYDPREDPLVNPDRTFADAPADPSAIAMNDVLYRNIEGNPRNLTPIFGSSTYEFYLSGVLFSGLFTFDRQMQWLVNDEVVESFAESDDHLVYTVKMKPGLTWHDGHPFTAHDVAFSYDVIMDDRVNCPAQRTGTDQLESVTALNDLTVEFRHEEASPTNVWNALFAIIPKHLYEVDRENNPDLESGEYYTELNRNVVGNGPYRFVEWVDNDKIVVERWDDYYGERPRFRRHVFRIIPDTNILMLTFNKGDVDEFRMTPLQFATQTLEGSDFDKAGGVKVWTPQWSFSLIGWNMSGTNPYFDDTRVRRAMTMACNIKRMMNDVCYNLYEQAYGVYHPDSWMFNDSIELLPFDLDEAERLLDEAGWRIDEEREGWRYKVIDGQPRRFEFTLLIPSGSTTSPQIAGIFQEDLKSIGVKMNTEKNEWATFQERCRKHEFDAIIMGFGTGVDPDTGWNLWHSSEYVPDGSRGRNYVGFQNERVDELFQMGRETYDQDERAEIYAEIQKIIYDEQPFTFLFNRAVLWGIHDRLRGVSAGPRGIFNFTPAEMAWWVPAGQAKAAGAEQF